MASPALSRPSIAFLPSNDRQIGMMAAEDMCNELLAHMLDCSLCLDPEEPACPVCAGLQSQISHVGKPAAGLVFAY